MSRLEEKVNSIAAALMLLLHVLQGTHDDEISEILNSLLDDMDRLAPKGSGDEE